MMMMQTSQATFGTKKGFTKLLAQIFFILGGVVVVYWVLQNQSSGMQNINLTDLEMEVGEEEVAQNTKIGTVIDIGISGDILLHKETQNQAFRHKDGLGYADLWKSLIPELKSHDLMVGNIEGTTAPRVTINYTHCEKVGVEEAELAAYGRLYHSWEPLGNSRSSNYFNYHPLIAENVRDSGVDILTAANNHAEDACLEGAIETAEVFENEGLIQLGIKIYDDDRWYRVKEVKGLKLGLVGCTYVLNPLITKDQYFGPPSNFTQEEWDRRLQQYIDRGLLWCGAPEFIEIIENLSKDPEIDGVIAFIHGGKEYSFFPTIHAVQYTDAALKAGADAIICNHPHVAQPIEFFQYDNRVVPVIWSVGNFISHQGYGKDHLGRYRTADTRKRASGVMTLKMKFTEVGLTYECFQYLPTCVRCAHTDLGYEFQVVDATKEPGCAPEIDWLKQVWGDHIETCDKVEPHPPSVTSSIYTNIRRAHKEIDVTKNPYGRKFEGEGFCRRNTASDYELSEFYHAP